MSTQISLDDEDIDIINDILKKHKDKVSMIPNWTDNGTEERWYSDISIMITKDNEELWYIQIN